jgi:hypothetical protein
MWMFSWVWDVLGALGACEATAIVFFWPSPRLAQGGGVRGKAK